jgi:hypothetical protein
MRHGARKGANGPCGRSHVEVEDTKWEDCAAGTEVLYHAVVSQAVSV